MAHCAVKLYVFLLPVRESCVCIQAGDDLIQSVKQQVLLLGVLCLQAPGCVKVQHQLFTETGLKHQMVRGICAYIIDGVCGGIRAIVLAANK